MTSLLAISGAALLALLSLGVASLGAAPLDTAFWNTASLNTVEVDGLVYIPGGKVRLGSDQQEKAFAYRIGGAAARRWKWFDRERKRVVTLAPFFMERTLVTNSDYARFVRLTGHRAPTISEADYLAQGFLVHPYSEVRPYLWPAGRPAEPRLSHPVVLVSVPDAQAYCAWKGRRLRSAGKIRVAAGGTGKARVGKTFVKARIRACRLPSEDEWELAARGRDGRYFPWGRDWRPERLNSAEKGPYGTTPVRAHPQGRSSLGLFDMAGNLFQWSATPGRPGYHVLKGCSWDDAGGICRAAARHDRKATSRHILIGFRCACDGEARGR